MVPIKGYITNVKIKKSRFLSKIGREIQPFCGVSKFCPKKIDQIATSENLYHFLFI